MALTARSLLRWAQRHVQGDHFAVSRPSAQECLGRLTIAEVELEVAKGRAKRRRIAQPRRGRARCGLARGTRGSFPLHAGNGRILDPEFKPNAAVREGRRAALDVGANVPVLKAR